MREQWQLQQGGSSYPAEDFFGISFPFSLPRGGGANSYLRRIAKRMGESVLLCL